MTIVVSLLCLQGADIIVFPECGLTTIYLPESRSELRPLLTPIPDPTQRKNPCLDSSGDVPEVTRENHGSVCTFVICHCDGN
jgi:hypothetical protein